MTTAPNVAFRNIRKRSLNTWLQGTGRSLKKFDTPTGTLWLDDYEEGKFECNWQIEARRLKQDNDWHVPHFCSLGDWASNVTDILTDSRYDGLTFGQDRTDLVLFRYYTKFMLVASELFTDFDDHLQVTFGLSPDDSRDELSVSQKSLQYLFDYINSICKHKIGHPSGSKRGPKKTLTKLHLCNHHLPFFFEDSGLKKLLSKPLEIGNSSEPKPDGVVVPKLEYLVESILKCYTVLDTKYKNAPPIFATFVSTSGEPKPQV